LITTALIRIETISNYILTTAVLLIRNLVYQDNPSLNGISKEGSIVAAMPLLVLLLGRIILQGHLSQRRGLLVASRILAAKIERHECGEDERHADRADEDAVPVAESGTRLVGKLFGLLSKRRPWKDREGVSSDELKGMASMTYLGAYLD
jgi:hypothetical protein